MGETLLDRGNVSTHCEEGDMSLNCDVYLMHYKPLLERLVFMKSQLEKFNINFTVISDEPEKSWFKDRIEIRIEKMKGLGGQYSEPITWPNASLAWKHLIFLENAMKSHRPSLALEDDAILSDNFVEATNRILQENEWDAVFPGSGCNLRKPGMGLIRVPHPASKCTDAYLITPKAAAKLHSTMKDGIDFAIDWELNYQMKLHNFRVFWHEPPIVRQGSQDGTWTSSINGKRENLFR